MGAHPSVATGAQNATNGIGSEFALEPGSITARASGALHSADLNDGIWLASGRAAIRLAVSTILAACAGRRRFLLPAYLCDSVLQPFREAGVPVEFYRLDERLFVDLNDLMGRLTSETAAVLIVHYFGFPQAPECGHALRALDPPVWIIEDVTHAWLADDTRTPGAARTIRICSPRKLGAVPDAGIAIGAGLTPATLGTLNPPDPPFVASRTVGLLLRAWSCRAPGSRANRAVLRLLGRAEHRLARDPLTRRGTRLSWRILSNWPLATMRSRRRANYETIARSLLADDRRFHPMFPSLPDGAVPLGFPLLATDRDNLRLHLIASGIFPPVHWVLPREAGIERFPHLTSLSNHVLTIPIDQRYGNAEMACILNALGDYET